MNRFLYTIAFYLLTPVFLLRLLWRSRSNPAYRQRLAERFGLIRKRATGKPCLWVHSVSVGETIAARPLVERLLAEYPAHDLWITTTTPTGSDTVKRLYGERVMHSYFPYDLPGAIRRFLERMQPAVLIVMETEIWPNLYHACGRRQLPLLMVNARLSEKSFSNYRKFASLTASTLANVSWIGARNPQDADYFRQLGLPAQRVAACGNIKFALQLPADVNSRATQLREAWGAQRPVLAAGSTHPGEDETLLAVSARLRQAVPELLLILVPRHPERFDAVHALCENAGLATVRRSSGQMPSADTAVLLGDSMGEMLLWYAAADIAFIGGSLIPRGGHNPLEAAAFGVPVLSGPHTHNFTDIFPQLYASGGAIEVADAAMLEKYALHWLQHPDSRQQAGQQAAAFFAEKQGVLDKLLQPIRTHIR